MASFCSMKLYKKIHKTASTMEHRLGGNLLCVPGPPPFKQLQNTAYSPLRWILAFMPEPERTTTEAKWQHKIQTWGFKLPPGKVCDRRVWDAGDNNMDSAVCVWNTSSERSAGTYSSHLWKHSGRYPPGSQDRALTVAKNSRRRSLVL